MARCPAHDDPSPSLSVAVGDSGRVLLHCFAGCSYGEVLDALEMRAADTFAEDDALEPLPSSSPPEPLPSDDNLELWHRALLSSSGALERLEQMKGWTSRAVQWAGLGLEGDRITIPIWDVDHLDLKTVVKYHPGGQFPKSKVLRGRGRHLWPDPATFSRHSVWIVEGEPDAISAFELGIPAVGLPGVHSWRQEYAQRFIGRRVLIALDADEQGRAAAERIAADLAELATPRVIDIAPERDDGYDWTDLLRDVIADESLETTRAAWRRITYTTGAKHDG